MSALPFTRLAFLLGSPDISGGTYVIFQHALYLMSQGVAVTIITEESVTPERIAWHPEAHRLRFVDYSAVRDETFDLVLATWWVTAYFLHRVRAHCYAFFNQSVESRFYPEADIATRAWADAVYLFGLPVVTEVTWIRDYLRKNFCLEAELAPNGVRKDVYTVRGPAVAPRTNGKLRVLVEGALGVPFKNVERTLQLCRESRAAEVWLMTPTKGVGELGGVARVFSAIPIAQTAEVYRSCDLLVKLSYVEGMFGPPLEMFHCGGTAIVYDVSGHEEYIRDQVNALVLPRDDEAGVVAAINLLQDDPQHLARLQAAALATAEQWPDWESASQRFARALCSIFARRDLLEPEALSGKLRVKSEFLRLWAESHRRLQDDFRETQSNHAQELSSVHQEYLHKIECLEREVRHLRVVLQEVENSRLRRLLTRLRALRAVSLRQ